MSILITYTSIIIISHQNPLSLLTKAYLTKLGLDVFVLHNI